jgi:lipopolysaccharide export LptBFGC system permease protein LptF
VRLVLHRYIFVELLKIFALSTGAITLFLSLANALGELRERGLGPIDSVQLVVFLVPAMLVFSMPIAALLTTTLVYGRLASDNEITACRASGISMGMLLRPVLVLGLLIGGLTFVLHDRVIPWSRGQAEITIKKNIERIFFHNIRTKQRANFGEFTMRAEMVDGNFLYGVVLENRRSDDRLFTTLAPAATVHFYPAKKSSSVPAAPKVSAGKGDPEPESGPALAARIARECSDARVGDYGSVVITLFQFTAYEEGPAKPRTVIEGNQSYTRRLIITRPRETEELTLGELISRYREPEKSYLYRYPQASGAPAESLMAIAGKLRSKALAEMHGRYAMIVTCVLLVILGAALGLRFRYGHILTAFFISMGPALFAIFAILMGTKLVRGSPEHMHALTWIVWSGNIVVAGINAVFVGRMLRR